MVNYNITEIKPNTRFKTDVMLDQMFLLTTPPCKITPEILSYLKKWGFLIILSDDEKPAAKLNEEKTAEPKRVILEKTESVDISEFSSDDSSSAISKESIPDKFKTSEEVDLSEFTDISAPSPKPQGTPQPAAQPFPSAPQSMDYAAKKAPSVPPQAFSLSDEPHSISLEEDKQHIKEAQKVYEKFMDFINQVYTKYATQKVILLPEINGKVLELCNFVRENKKFILRVSPSFEVRNKNFLISHSVRTTILSIVIGFQLKLPYERLIELGVASVLHEIGQIRLPPQLYINDRTLTPSEKAQMQTHTVLGYNIAKEAGLPLTIQLGILDHHERETGTGYPRHLTGNKISLYAKIIGVACSFEAITAPRHFKEARTTYEAMVEMLKNSSHLYDDAIVKALLYSLSLYPIGAFVFLSNGRVAQVVDVSPSNPKNPIVQIIGSINPDGTPKRIQTDNNSVKIIRVMNKEESADLKKSLGDKI